MNIDPSDLNISFVDFSDLPDDKRSGKITELINSDSRLRFDLEKGPLFRLYLVKQPIWMSLFPHEHPHIIFDGWSHGILQMNWEGPITV